MTKPLNNWWLYGDNSILPLGDFHLEDEVKETHEFIQVIVAPRCRPIVHVVNDGIERMHKASGPPSISFIATYHSRTFIDIVLCEGRGIVRVLPPVVALGAKWFRIKITLLGSVYVLNMNDFNVLGVTQRALQLGVGLREEILEHLETVLQDMVEC